LKIIHNFAVKSNQLLCFEKNKFTKASLKQNKKVEERVKKRYRKRKWIFGEIV